MSDRSNLSTTSLASSSTFLSTTESASFIFPGLSDLLTEFLNLSHECAFCGSINRIHVIFLASDTELVTSPFHERYDIREAVGIVRELVARVAIQH